MRSDAESGGTSIMIGFLLRAVLALIVGIGLYLIDIRLAMIPIYGSTAFGLTTKGVRSEVEFLLLLLTILVLLIPLFQDGWSMETRTFSIMTGVVIAVIALGRASGLITFDPDLFLAGIAHSEPVRKLQYFFRQAGPR